MLDGPLMLTDEQPRRTRGRSAAAFYASVVTFLRIRRQVLRQIRLFFDRVGGVTEVEYQTKGPLLLVSTTRQVLGCDAGHKIGKP